MGRIGDILDPETGLQAVRTYFYSCFYYQIFNFLRLCRFSADRNETFHTYYLQYSASSYRGGLLP